MTSSHTSSTAARSQWDLFLRAFVREIDGVLNIAARDALLRRAGAQMSRDFPLAAVETLEDLEKEANEALAALEWGQAHFALDEASRVVKILHSRLPTLWLSAALEGLYTGWFSQQPNADPGFVARRGAPRVDASINLVYGRADRVGDTSHRDSGRASEPDG